MLRNQSSGRAAGFCGKSHLAGSENDVKSKVNPPRRVILSLLTRIKDGRNPKIGMKNYIYLHK